MDIAGQSGLKINAGQVLFSVEHGLIQVGNTPPLGDIEVEKPGQLLGSRAGAGISPGTERRQQLAVLVKYQISMHHGRKTNGANGFQRHAILIPYFLCQTGIAGLETFPHLFQRIGPVSVLPAVFPLISARSQRRVIRSNQHSFDAGGAELNAQSGLSGGYDFSDLILIHTDFALSYI